MDVINMTINVLFSRQSLPTNVALMVQMRCLGHGVKGVFGGRKGLFKAKKCIWGCKGVFVWCNGKCPGGTLLVPWSPVSRMSKMSK